MPQPYNYNINQPSALDSVRTASGLIGLQQIVQQQQEAAVAKKKREQLTMGLQQLDHNNPEQVQALAQQYPRQLEQIQSYQDFQTGQGQKQIKNAVGDLIQSAQTGDQNLIDQTIDQHADLINSSGNEAITPEVLKRIAKNNPQIFMEMMRGSYGRVGGDPDTLGIGLEWEKVRGIQRKNNIDALKTKLENEKNMLERQKLENEIETEQRILEKYGDLGAEGATEIYQKANKFSSTHGMLNNMLNVVVDLEKEGTALNADRGLSLMRNFVGNVPLTDKERAAMVARLDAGSIDIAIELSDALKPVSQEQFKKLIDSIRGGNIVEAKQNILSTMGRMENNYQEQLDTLEVTNAKGLLSQLDPLQRERKEGLVQAEGSGFPTQTPPATATAAAAPPPQQDDQPIAPPSAPPSAISHLRANPQLIDQFIEFYGYRPEGF